MGSKYNQHILDPWLNPKIVANFDEIEKYKNLGDQVWINEPLAKFGQSEQQKIFDGKIGSTMLAGAARTQGARDIAATKANQRLGSAAMSRRGGNASSAAINTIYDRMLQDQTNRVNDRTAGIVAGGLPEYTNAAAGWAEAGNRGLREKLGYGQAYQQMFSNAVQQRMSNQTFEKKKSLWDKIKEGVGVAGNIMGIASGIGSVFPMGGGGGGNVTQKYNPNQGASSYAFGGSQWGADF